ncbi:MAG: Fe-S cluster assembly ATPase SufC [Candidatus Magasanikbacteria bacterium]|nr:Fe-S cluster assembly ATPase SufC [Candidatus Magasanikbacteria bacterium]
MSLDIQNLAIAVADKKIVHGVSLEIKPGEVHTIMGPNGSGKSTLANALLGHPKYTITEGQILLDGKEITKDSPDKRARAGLFLSMQHPPEIPGVSVANFLRLAVGAVSGNPQNPLTFFPELTKQMAGLGIDPEFAKRHVHGGFSGGEKKKVEILQLLLLNPKYAILDETDSGLDVDALKIVAAGINRFKSKNNSVLLITHYNRILEYVIPDFVHIMVGGKIVKSGGKELAREIEKNGYLSFRNDDKI